MGHVGLPKMPGYKSVPVTEVWEGGGSVEAGEKHYMQPPHRPIFGQQLLTPEHSASCLFILQ